MSKSKYSSIYYPTEYSFICKYNKIRVKYGICFTTPPQTVTLNFLFVKNLKFNKIKFTKESATLKSS